MVSTSLPSYLKLHCADHEFDHESDFDAQQYVAAMDPMPLSEVSSGAARSGQSSGWGDEIAQWQCDTLPVGTRLAPNWSVDAMVESPLAVAQSWHHWDVLPDGILALAMCQFGHGWDPEGNLVDMLDATVARAALQSHLGYRHTPHDAVTRVLHTLLQVRDAAIDASGRPNLSLLYAHVDPETGRAVISSIGQCSTLVASKYGYRPLSLGRDRGSASDGFPQEMPIVDHETTLLEGEALLVTGANWMGMDADIMPQASIGHGPVRNDSRRYRHESVQHQVGSAVRQAMRQGERSPLSALRRFTASLPLTQERSAIALVHDSNR